jgi:hypothetical protein
MDGAAGDLHVQQAFGNGVAARDFAGDVLERGAAYRHRHLDFTDRTFEAIKMLLLVEKPAVRDAANLVDGVAKLQSAILHVHPGLAMDEITAVDIGDATGRFAGRPTRHAGRHQWFAADFSG